MTEFPRRVELGIVLRSLTIQGSWNYETLIGTGFAFTLIPALRIAYAGDPDGLRGAVARHAGVFNSHPYLVTLAAGAVARLEAEQAEPAVVERFKSALRGSLGSLGDRLFWTAWRPAAVLLGLVLFLLGAAWWVAVAVFLILYNALHLVLRSWGAKVGIRHGLEVARVLRQAPLQAITTRAGDAGAFLAGVAVVLFIGREQGNPAEMGLMAVGAGLGLWLGLRARAVAGFTLGALWILALILGLVL